MWVVIVHITNKRELEVASIYPVTETKIKNRRIKEFAVKDKILIDRFSYKDEKELVTE